MVYEYFCDKCNETKEIIESMAEHTSDKVVKCHRCKKRMKPVITGGTYRFMGPKSIGMAINKNTDKLSLDEKISIGTNKYKTINESLNPDQARQDQQANIARETKEIIQGHNS